MGFLGDGVTFLNMDGTYVSQRRLFRFPHEWLELADIGQTNLYCAPDSLRELERRLRKRTRRGLAFIGSGNYHYISYLLMKEIHKPFTLVLFDHHTDLGAERGDMISCGSWVSHALQLPMLQKIVMAGPAQPSFHDSSTIAILPNSLCSSQLLLSHIPTDYIYISIDKDVLCEEDAITNWEQGTMKLFDLLECLRELLAHKRVLGVDVCGEYPQAAVDLFHPLSKEANRKNERANELIAALCLHAAVMQPHPA